MTKAELIAFEDDIRDCFARGEIAAPVHLAGGNEDQLIEIFQKIRPQDWVLTSWRSHYHCLLKGVPPDEVKAAILAGRSIALCFAEHRQLSSAIVGGICPIAVGLGWAIKRSGEDARVWCFIGDMTAATGIFHESSWYATNHFLPVTWVVEDNGLSVCTNTKEAWGSDGTRFDPHVIRYDYSMTWPHVGIGQWVRF